MGNGGIIGCRGRGGRRVECGKFGRAGGRKGADPTVSGRDRSCRVDMKHGSQEGGVMGEPGERAYRNQEDMENGIVKFVGCRGGIATGRRGYHRSTGELGQWGWGPGG